MTVSSAPSGWTKSVVSLNVGEQSDNGGSGIKAGYPKYSAAGAQPIAETSGSSITITSDGETTVTFVIMDNLGNSASVTRTVKIDSVGPEIHVSQSPTTWTSGAVTLNASVTDIGSGVRSGSIGYKIGNAPGYTYTDNPKNITVPENCTVVFTAQDMLSTPATVSYRVENIDKTAPAFTVSSVPSGWTNTDVRVSVTAKSDEASGIATGYPKYTANGGQAISETSGESCTITAEGSTTVTFSLKDVAGNMAVPVNRIVKIDKTAPVLTLSAVPAGWANSDVTVSVVSKSDERSGIAAGYPKVSTSGAQLTASASGDSITIGAEGTTVVVFTLIDTAGNTTTASRTVKIDKTAPVLTLSAVPSGWTNSDVTLSVTAQSDERSGIASGFPKYSAVGAQPLTPASGTSVTIGTEGKTTVTFSLRECRG